MHQPSLRLKSTLGQLAHTAATAAAASAAAAAAAAAPETAAAALIITTLLFIPNLATVITQRIHAPPCFLAKLRQGLKPRAQRGHSIGMRLCVSV
jgi:hypothetical protein